MISGGLRLGAVAVGFVALAAVSASPALGATTITQFETRAADGTALRGDVYLPDSRKPLATVLRLSPYWNNANGPSEDQAEAGYVKPFLDEGFAVALINIRGTGESGGCFQWGSRLDWSDSARIIEALAARPWSNGKVGMYGTSFEAWTQYMAIAGGAPALKAIAPISGVIDVWSLVTRRGAPIAIGPTASTEFGLLTSFAGVEPENLNHLRCPDYEPHLEQGLGLVADGSRNSYYRQRDLRARIRDTRVPVLMANGIDYFNEGHTQQFEGLWSRLRSDRTRFMLGQWPHGGKREDFNDLAVGWFDHYLRGGPQTTKPGIVEYQDDAQDWHTTKRWPPPADREALQLSGDNLIAADRRAERSSRSFQTLELDTPVDAAETVLEQPPAKSQPEPGPLCGSHQILYRSPPLAREARIAGNFSIDLTVSSSLSGGNLVATLYRVEGDGSCFELLSAGADVGRVELDLRHWREAGQAHPFPVDTPTRVRAKSLPLAAVVRSGERLVLALGGGSAELLPDPLQPEVAIATGSAGPSTLELPIDAGELRFR